MAGAGGTQVSAITIQKILNENDPGTNSDRWLALEKANAETAIELTPEQAALIEKLNPCFRERHVESSAPGELLSADTFFVGSLKGIGRVYLHAVVDSFGSYAFGLPRMSPSNLRLQRRCCTTTCCHSAATLTCRSARCSLTTS